MLPPLLCNRYSIIQDASLRTGRDSSTLPDNVMMMADPALAIQHGMALVTCRRAAPGGDPESVSPTLLTTGEKYPNLIEDSEDDPYW